MAVTEFEKLPEANSPTIELVTPTPEEQIQAWYNNSVAWKGAFDRETYLRREQYLTGVPLARDEGVSHWILTETHLPPNERPILGSCESLRKKALVRDRSGQMHEVMTHGVGSVFAPPEYRGRGYASRMMSELGKKLATWQIEDKPWRNECPFSFLYSDIGKKYYASFGWHPFPSVHFSFPPAAPYEIERTGKALSSDELGKLCALDEQKLRKTLAEAPLDGKTRIALIPNIETMQWHHMREDWVTKQLFGKSPEIKGAIAGAPGHRVWAIWTRSYSSPLKAGGASEGNTLYILRLVLEDEGAEAADENEQVAHLRDILSLAQEQAAEWQLHHVELWNPTAQARKLIEKTNLSHAEVHRESESIPSVRWYGDESVKAEDIDWVLNEKFGWC